MNDSTQLDWQHSWRAMKAAAATVLAAFLFGTATAAQSPGQASTGTNSATTNGAVASKDKEKTCRVSGMVVKMVDGAPLKNATVQLRNNEDQQHIIAMKTTADGKFEL